MKKFTEDAKKTNAAADKATNAVKVSLEDLEKLSGGADPFKDIPRVENKSIDEKLREDS